jgi:hypothetical protein
MMMIMMMMIMMIMIMMMMMMIEILRAKKVKKSLLFHGPPGKRRKEELKGKRMRRNIWEKRFKEPIRQSHMEHFETTAQEYIDEGHTFKRLTIALLMTNYLN